jgi:F0F1-type ATP synthase assembly protein I
MQGVTDRAKEMFQKSIGPYIWSGKDLIKAVILGVGIGVLIGWML